MKYSIEKVTTLIGARRIGEADAQIGWLLTDSRSLCFPEETLFFALRSSRNDGHRYIDEVIKLDQAIRDILAKSSSSPQKRQGPKKRVFQRKEDKSSQRRQDI